MPTFKYDKRLPEVNRPILKLTQYLIPAPSTFFDRGERKEQQDAKSPTPSIFPKPRPK
jgi:hypothetical protein